MTSGARVEVVRAGLHTTVQDAGRPGWAHLGVPAAGALDPVALGLANACVGNLSGAAGLECTLRGPRLRFPAGGTVAWVGAPVSGTVDGAPLPPGHPVAVPPGGEVDVGAIRVGLRGWLAVAGGIATEPVLGSRSVDTLGGLGGRPLQAGDVLPLGPPPRHPPPGPGAPDWPPLPGDGALRCRVVPGPHADWFAGSPAASAYTVTPRSDRTGLRLDGPPLTRVDPARELVSIGVPAGAVQVPPDGRPVVLLANHQTAGGYPVAAVVCAADLPGLAQARPGTVLSFVPVTVPEARAAYAEVLRRLGSPPC